MSNLFGDAYILQWKHEIWAVKSPMRNVCSGFSWYDSIHSIKGGARKGFVGAQES